MQCRTLGKNAKCKKAWRFSLYAWYRKVCCPAGRALVFLGNLMSVCRKNCRTLFLSGLSPPVCYLFSLSGDVPCRQIDCVLPFSFPCGSKSHKQVLSAVGMPSTVIPILRDSVPVFFRGSAGFTLRGLNCSTQADLASCMKWMEAVR